jgi:hypothetical protein
MAKGRGAVCDFAGSRVPRMTHADLFTGTACTPAALSLRQVDLFQLSEYNLALCK